MDNFNEICREDGYPETTLEEYLNNFEFPSIKYYLKHGFDVSRFDVLAARFQTKYENVWKKKASLFDGVEETLKEFKSRGFKLYVLSATREWFLKYQLTELGIIDLFDGMVGSSNGLGESKIEFGKRYILSQNLNLDECVMVGDTVHDFEVATAIGIDCVLSTLGHCTKERLSVCNVEMVDSFKELLNVIK